MITHMKQVKTQIDYTLEIKKINRYLLIYNVEDIMIIEI